MCSCIAPTMRHECALALGNLSSTAMYNCMMRLSAIHALCTHCTLCMSHDMHDSMTCMTLTITAMQQRVSTTQPLRHDCDGGEPLRWHLGDHSRTEACHDLHSHPCNSQELQLLL